MNARLALSHALNTHPEREHPDYWRDTEREVAFIEAESRSLADKMHARLMRGAPDQYEVADQFASSAGVAFYRLMQLAEQGNADALLAAVKKLANEAIDLRAEQLATQAWQKIDV